MTTLLMRLATILIGATAVLTCPPAAYAQAPGAFGKVSPVIGATGVSRNPTVLTWSAASGATSYEYCYTLSASCFSYTSVGNALNVDVPALGGNLLWTWQVRAVGPTGQTTYADGGTFWTFTTIGNPGTFGKSSPNDFATQLPTSPTLAWTTSTNATEYQYCIDAVNDSACTSPATWVTAGANLNVIVPGLSPCTTYFWQIRSANSGGGQTYADGSSSSYRRFTATCGPGAFNKSSPPNFTFGQPLNPTLTWTASSGATSYEYCLDTTDDGACNTSYLTVGANTSANPTGLLTCTAYYWQVRARDANGTTPADEGAIPAFWRFNTICPPAAFGKTSPTNGTISVGPTVTLTWASASGAIGYAYCFDETNDNACSNWSSPSSATQAFLSGLTPTTTYYWQARASGGGSTTDADGGTYWSFTTGPGAFNRIGPADKTGGYSSRPTLSWGPSTGAASYEYCYDTSDDGVCGNWTSAGANTGAPLSGLSLNQPYTWHVRAIGPTGTTYANGASTDFWTFMTGNAGLAGVVQALAVDPSSSQTVYAGTTQGIYRSVNGGANWTRVDSGLTYTNVRALAIRPEAPCTIVAGIDSALNNTTNFDGSITPRNTNGVVVMSTDCGANWGIPVSAPFGRRTESLAFSSAVPSVLYAAVVRNDATCPFTCINLQTGSVTRLVIPGGVGTETHFFSSSFATNVLATDPANPCTAYYVLSEFNAGTVYTNTSCSGGTWTTVGSAFNAPVTALVVHPTNQATLLAGTSSGGIYRKIDAGTPWTLVASVSGAPNSILYEPGSSLVAYAVTGGGFVYKTTDGGGSWNQTNSIGSALLALAVSPSSPSTFYVGGEPFVYQLSAGVTRIISLSGNLAFGSVPAGSTPTSTLTITNSGNSTLTISSITYPGGFSGAFAGSVAPGAFQNVTVTFAPVAAIAYGGTVTVNGDQTNGTNTIGASGIGTVPATRIIGLSGSLAFGNAAVGTTPTRTLTITNTGNSTLTVSGITYPSGFSGAWSGPIAAGGQQDVTVTFSPLAVAAYGGTVTVNSDKTSGTETTAASGAGVAGAKRFDFTGDRKSDVLWRNSTGGDVWLWPMNGAAKTAEHYVRTVDSPWEIRSLGDHDGDGKADLVWRHPTAGLVYFWPMNGNTPQAEMYVRTVPVEYDIVGTGDYDGDTRSDLLWRHGPTGALWMWLMNGATVVSETYVDTVNPAYAVVGSGDLSGDQKADIVWRHTTDGSLWAWTMNGATRTSQAYVGTVDDLGYEVVGVADHTGDGKADLLWRHATRGEVWIWVMNGAAVQSQAYVGTVSDTGYHIVANGDYNGDGMADILWHHATGGDAWVWLMNGTTKISETWIGTVPDPAYQIVKVK